MNEVQLEMLQIGKIGKWPLEDIVLGICNPESALKSCTRVTVGPTGCKLRVQAHAWPCQYRMHGSGHAV